MPSTPEAIEVYQKNGLLYGPAKAANAVASPFPAWR